MVKRQNTNQKVIKIFETKTSCEAETIEIARKLIPKLPVNTLIALVGAVGSGKTTFVKGLALGAKYRNTVSSPSFVIQKIYVGTKIIYHIDLYRLKNAVNIDDFLEPLVGEGIWAIEWADKLPDKFLEQHNYLKVEFFHLDRHSRTLKFSTNLKKLNISIKHI